MEGHIHIGVADALPFAFKLIIVLAVLRLMVILAVNSSIPLLNKPGKALAWIVG
jgi:hypothetical protein